eukprot:NODE_100_length_3202_cov_34.411057_g93_i0.p1 GENE.NODE_100_length_3202_cov_34.411057_g93_i0~~NODE_100_length_3202_cov_34.411057_g93_i0.p1  ORF type:complete len:1039 (-),score=176.57 NODE_100_length_3202_cov_34.411057_g93_i0:84-2918(-)
MDTVRYGIIYKVILSAKAHPTIQTFFYLHAPPCSDPATYAFYGSLLGQCYPCPVGGECDGTHLVKAQTGFWRNRTQSFQTPAATVTELTSPRHFVQFTDFSDPTHADLYVFHECKVSEACAGEDRYAAQCSAGYSENLCTVCLEGYGRNLENCNPCFDSSTSAFLVFLFFIGLTFVLSVLVYAALEDNKLFGKHNAESRYISVVLKLFWNHLQMVSVIVEFKIGWPKAMVVVFEIANNISNCNLNFKSFNCAISMGTDIVVQARLMMYVSLPFIALILTTLALGSLWYYKRTHGRPTFLPEKLVTANVVTTFLLYPTVLRRIAEMFICREMYGKKWLEQQLSYECDTSDHKDWQIIAGMFAILYGAVLPIAAILIIFRHERQPGGLATRECMNSLGFLYRGYRRTRWFWEIIIHLRKLAFVAIVTIGVTEKLLQSYSALWVVSVALLLNLFFVPYSHEFTNKLENFSLATVFTTINIGLLFAEVEDRDEGLAIFLTIFLLVLNFVCIVLFFIIFLQKLEHAIYLHFDQDGDGDLSLRDIWEIIMERVFHKARHPAVNMPNPNMIRPGWNADEQAEPKDEQAQDLPEATDKGKGTEEPSHDPDETPESPTKPGAAPPPPPRPESVDGSLDSSVRWPVEVEKDGPTYPTAPTSYIPGAVSPQMYGSQLPYAPVYGGAPPFPDMSYSAGPPSYPLYGGTSLPPMQQSHDDQQLWLRAAEKNPPPLVDYPAYASIDKGAPSWNDPPIAGSADYGGPQQYGSRDDDDSSTATGRTKLRVGLRAPENDERAKITLLTDLAGHSCQSVYLYYCKQYETKPKPQVRLALPDTPNEFGMEELILNETTLIGNKGLLPVLEVVRLNTGMKALSVIGNGIKNTGVEWLVHTALDHPSLTAIDLSDNRITNAAGTVLNYLAQRNPRITEVNITNTRIDEQLKQHIELRLKTNREHQ